MKKSLVTVVIGVCLSLASNTFAQSLAEQWRKGLSGAKLTAYSGSVTSSNSSLTVLNICANGRYSYYREASWSADGAAGGASNNRITGEWDVSQNGMQVAITYVTDSGESGAFPVYLQSNGRVNIGGLAYAVQAGAAEC